MEDPGQNQYRDEVPYKGPGHGLVPGEIELYYRPGYGKPQLTDGGRGHPNGGQDIGYFQGTVLSFAEVLKSVVGLTPAGLFFMDISITADQIVYHLFILSRKELVKNRR